MLVPSSSRIIHHMYVWCGGCCTTARCAWAATACGYALPPWRDSDCAKEGCAPHALHPMWCGCVGVPTFARSSAQERAWCALPASPDSRSAHKLHTTCCCAPCALSDALRGVVACQVRVSSACLIAACVVRCLSPLHTPHNPRRHHPGGSATTPCKLMPQRRGTRCLRQYAATALHIVMSALIGTGQRMPSTGRGVLRAECWPHLAHSRTPNRIVSRVSQPSPTVSCGADAQVEGLCAGYSPNHWHTPRPAVPGLYFIHPAMRRVL